MLLLLLSNLLFLGFFVLLMGSKNALLAKAINILGLLLSLGIFLLLHQEANSFTIPWISSWNINFSLSLDDFSFWLIALSLFIGSIASFFVSDSKKAHHEQACISLTIFGSTGLFLANDIFLFFVFWEISLLPLYWILLSQKNAQGLKAALRYIIFTQASGIFLLISMIALAFVHYKSTGVLSFDYDMLVKNNSFYAANSYILFGFALAFLIKLPIIPFHSWMPEVFAHCPSALVLVAVLIKTACYGLIRFSWPLFPESCADFSLFFMSLGLLTLIYGALLAFSEQNLKKIFAYSTLSHAGLMLMGIFANNTLSFFGIILLLITQCISTGGALLLVNQLESVDINMSAGMWHKNTHYAVALLIFLLAGFGFPVFGNFVGEWFVLVSLYQTSSLLGLLTLLGLVLGVVYSLRVFQKICFGHSDSPSVIVNEYQGFVYAVMMAALLFLGLKPLPLNIETQENTLISSYENEVDSL